MWINSPLIGDKTKQEVNKVYKTNNLTPCKTPTKYRNNILSNQNEKLYSSQHLFQPCSIIKTDSESDVALVKTSCDGMLHNIKDPIIKTL